MLLVGSEQARWLVVAATSNVDGMSKTFFAQLIEPATILTLGVAAVYLIGWAYLGGYFQQVGFLPNSLWNFQPHTT